MRITIIVALALLAAHASVAEATHPLPGEMIFVTLNGQNEVTDAGVPGQGDPDGFAFARLEEDHGFALIWEITYGNLSGQVVSGLHIHGPGATPSNNRPVFINFPLGDVAMLPSGTLRGTILPTDDPNLPAKIQQVYANPSEFYLNLHTEGAGGFPNGAVRGQLPEPGAGGFSLACATGLLLRRRSRGKNSA
jgi:CHRD domain